MNRLIFHASITMVTGASLLSFIGINSAQAITLTTFSPIGFSDAIAGITGFQIEDFEEVITVKTWIKEQGIAQAGDQLFPGAAAQTVAVFRVSPDAAGLRLAVNNDKYFSIE